MKRDDKNSEIGRIAIVIIHFMWKKKDYDLSFYFLNLLFRPNEGKCFVILRWSKNFKNKTLYKKKTIVRISSSNRKCQKPSLDKQGDTKFELLIWSSRKVKCVLKLVS